MPLYNPLDSTAITDGTITTTDIDTTSFDARYPALDANGHFAETALGAQAQRSYLARRTGALSETMSRAVSTLSGQSITSGRLNLIGIPLTKGTTVTNITFVSGSTALSGGNNYWFGLWSPAQVQLGLTADQTSTAWAANAEKTLALASPYSVTADGWYFISIMVNATTPPTLAGFATTTAVAFLTPILAAFDGNHTGLTTPAGAPAPATLTAGLGGTLYAYVS